MEPPARIGDSLDAIDTPALLVDLEALDRNLKRMADALRGMNVALRPHAKSHKSVDLALKQLGMGSIGVCCQKVSEAEVFAAGGIRNILISNEVVGQQKLERFARLAESVEVSVCVDDIQHVEALSRAARDAGQVLKVLVEVDVGSRRCGVLPGQAVVELAKAIDRTHRLEFVGLQAYHGRAQHVRNAQERADAARAAAEAAATSLEALERAGIACKTVTGGGTGTFLFDAKSGIYTEVQPGSYVFMDVDYSLNSLGTQEAEATFEHALYVLTTVMSKPTTDRAVVDAGLKALSVDSGMPVVHGRPGTEFQRAADEHGVLALESSVTDLEIGRKLLLVPGHCDPTVNLHDWFVCVRQGRVADLWPVSARGAVF